MGQLDASNLASEGASDQVTDYFGLNYEVLVNEHVLPGARRRKTPSETGLSCRYCGENNRKRFRTSAHAIPQLLGNRALLASDECDSCNAYFSKELDSHLGNWLGVTRTLSQVRGARGVPSFTGRKGKSRIDFDGAGLRVVERPGDPLAAIDFTAKTLRIETARCPYIPLAVFKSLQKCALSLLPIDELLHFDRRLRWIRAKPHLASGVGFAPALVLETTIPGPPPIPGVGLLLLRRKRGAEVPYLQCILGFGNHVLQFAVHSFDRDAHFAGRPMTVPSFPTGMESHARYGRSRRRVVDLSSEQMIVGDPQIATMHFESSEEIDSPIDH